jgi:DNA/RNA-binding domain of Phe-tRNA-synthetase-like protein
MADPDPLTADSDKEAVYVSQWRNSQAIALGDETKEEFIIAPEAHDLDEMC